jgi:hypothetical protein
MKMRLNLNKQIMAGGRWGVKKPAAGNSRFGRDEGELLFAPTSAIGRARQMRTADYLPGLPCASLIRTSRMKITRGT